MIGEPEGQSEDVSAIRASRSWTDHVERLQIGRYDDLPSPETCFAAEHDVIPHAVGVVVCGQRNTHTALHELGHATGHPSRLNRPTLVEHGDFGTETYAREKLRAKIAAIMTGERLGVGHEPRHGTAYVSSCIKALENDPREIRTAAVYAQRISDWLLSRERERSLGDEKAEPERPEGAAGRTPQREPERPPAPEVGEDPQAEHVSAMKVPDRPAQAVDPARGGAAAAPGAPAMSEDPKAVLRDMGAAGYRRGTRRR